MCPEDESDLPEFDSAATSFTYGAWHGYWHLFREGTAGVPFGFGLSYTSFAVERVESSVVAGRARVTCTARNTGDRRGADVVQVYARRLGSDRPPKLAAFVRVELEAGRSSELTVEVPDASLAERDVRSHSMVVRAGRYELRVARHAADPGTVTEVLLGDAP